MVSNFNVGSASKPTPTLLQVSLNQVESIILQRELRRNMRRLVKVLLVLFVIAALWKVVSTDAEVDVEYDDA